MYWNGISKSVCHPYRGEGGGRSHPVADCFVRTLGQGAQDQDQVTRGRHLGTETESKGGTFYPEQYCR